jgi:hypothetical protein
MMVSTLRQELWALEAKLPFKKATARARLIVQIKQVQKWLDRVELAQKNLPIVHTARRNEIKPKLAEAEARLRNATSEVDRIRFGASVEFYREQLRQITLGNSSWDVSPDVECDNERLAGIRSRDPLSFDDDTESDSQPPVHTLRRGQNADKLFKPLWR